MSPTNGDSFGVVFKSDQGRCIRFGATRLNLISGGLASALSWEPDLGGPSASPQPQAAPKPPHLAHLLPPRSLPAPLALPAAVPAKRASPEPPQHPAHPQHPRQPRQPACIPRQLPQPPRLPWLPQLPPAADPVPSTGAQPARRAQPASARLQDLQLDLHPSGRAHHAGAAANRLPAARLLSKPRPRLTLAQASSGQPRCHRSHALSARPQPPAARCTCCPPCR
jgi:hypothetical protein